MQCFILQIDYILQINVFIKKTRWKHQKWEHTTLHQNHHLGLYLKRNYDWIVNWSCTFINALEITTIKWKSLKAYMKMTFANKKSLRLFFFPMNIAKTNLHYGKIMLAWRQQTNMESSHVWTPRKRRAITNTRPLDQRANVWKRSTILLCRNNNMMIALFTFVNSAINKLLPDLNLREIGKAGDLRISHYS